MSRNRKKQLSDLYLSLTFFVIAIYNIFYAPLSDLFWKTNRQRTDKIRLSPFSIRRFLGNGVTGYQIENLSRLDHRHYTLCLKHGGAEAAWNMSNIFTEVKMLKYFGVGLDKQKCRSKDNIKISSSHLWQLFEHLMFGRGTKLVSLIWTKKRLFIKEAAQNYTRNPKNIYFFLWL